MKQKKRRVKLFNPLTEQVEKTLSKIKHNLISCPLPSDIEDLIQSIFNSLIDSIPDIDPDFDLDTNYPINAQILDKITNRYDINNNEQISFDDFWSEWLKFRASVWSLSSISVVDDIYQSYIKERLEELKIIIDNVENQEQLSSPVVKYEFTQARDLVNKAIINLQNIIFNQITEFDDFDDENDTVINTEKEQERIRGLMSHRMQIRHIKDDFSTRYKNFFQLSSQERSITDVQHRRCVSIIDEMLNALNKLGKQQSNFKNLKEELYLAEKKLFEETVPKPKTVFVTLMYKDQEGNAILPEDAESETAESIISSILGSRNNSPFNSPTRSYPIENDEEETEGETEGEIELVPQTPLKKSIGERSWKTPEPKAKPARIQPLSLHDMSGVPDSFRDLSRRFNTSDSESLSTPSPPESKKAAQQGKARLAKKSSLRQAQPKMKQKRQQQARRTVTFAVEKQQTDPSENEKKAEEEKVLNNTSQSENNASHQQLSKPPTDAASTRQQQQKPPNFTSQGQTSASRGRQAGSKSKRKPGEDPVNVLDITIDASQPVREDSLSDERAESASTSSYTSDNEYPATVGAMSKTLPPPRTAAVSPKGAQRKTAKTAKSDASILEYQRQREQQRQKQQAPKSSQFTSSFLLPKKPSPDAKRNSTSGSIFSSASPLNKSLDSISQRASGGQQKHRHSANPTRVRDAKSSSSSATPVSSPQQQQQPSSPLNRSASSAASEVEVEVGAGDSDGYDDRDELTRLKDDYETLNIQLNVYAEENRELQAANEELPFLRRKVLLCEELETFYADEIDRLIQTNTSLSNRLKKNAKDESTYLENSRLHREKDQLFAKLQTVQKELSAVSKSGNKEIQLMLRDEREKNERLALQNRELREKLQQKNGNDDNNRHSTFSMHRELVKQQITIQNMNVKILHLKSKVKSLKNRLNSDDSSQTRESKEIERLENEIAAIRNSFESIQDLRYEQEDELFKQQTKNAFLASTIDKLKQKMGNRSFDIESEVMAEMKEKITENFRLKEENDKVKSALFELYHLICGEALTDNVTDVTVLLDGIRQQLSSEDAKK